tara:strand:- start:322 stop:663 length:342 start_codon:yes stop_codon:yes gene_type:complete
MVIFFKKNNFFFISIGAIPGALIRWQIDKIFIVNFIGCFLLGLMNSLPISKRSKLIFCFGFCGSMTTFSGWSFQLFELLSHGLFKTFLFNSIFLVLIGVFAAGLGHMIGNKFN